MLRTLNRTAVHSLYALHGDRTGRYRQTYHLVSVETPELEFLLEKRTTHVGRVVQLAGAIVVEYLRENARMAVEEILVEYRVVVGERLSETRQTSGRDLLQRRLVRLVSDATHVEDDSVLGV